MDAPFAPGGARLDRDALEAWGRTLGQDLPGGTVLLLTGDLGAGKTTLAQAICRGAGVAEVVTSPTFTIVHEYEGTRGVVRHLDLYRLRGPAELEALGWDELVSGDALTIVEWPERAEGRWPSRPLVVRLAMAPDAPEVRLVEAAWR